LAYGDLTISCLMALLCESSIAFIVLLKVRRDGNRSLTPFLMLDTMIVVVLPLFLSIAVPLTSATMQKLFVSGFLFYSSIGLIYLLFSSDATRSLIPFASLFLLLSISVLTLSFARDAQGSDMVLYTYYFLDEITISTFMVSFFATLLPLFRMIGSRIGTKLDSRHLENTPRENDSDHRDLGLSISNSRQLMPSIYPPKSFLREPLQLLRNGKYRQCVESCDTELERVILSRLFELFSTNIDLPMSLQQQISLLMSKDVSLPSSDILRLREFRNALTLSSQEVTLSDAKWAMRLTQEAIRVMKNSGTLHRQPEKE
jgi:hypothetical protein